MNAIESQLEPEEVKLLQRLKMKPEISDELWFIGKNPECATRMYFEEWQEIAETIEQHLNKSRIQNRDEFNELLSKLRVFIKTHKIKAYQ